MSGFASFEQGRAGARAVEAALAEHYGSLELETFPQVMATLELAMARAFIRANPDPGAHVGGVLIIPRHIAGLLEMGERLLADG